MSAYQSCLKFFRGALRHAKNIFLDMDNSNSRQDWAEKLINGWLSSLLLLQEDGLQLFRAYFLRAMFDQNLCMWDEFNKHGDLAVKGQTKHQ